VPVFPPCYFPTYCTVDALMPFLLMQVDSFEAGTGSQHAVSRFQTWVPTAWQNLAYQVYGTMLPQREVDKALKEAAAHVQALPAHSLSAKDELMLRLITSTLGLDDDGHATDDIGQQPQQNPSLTREPPREYVCPISLDVMSDPVMLVESAQVFDRSSIT
jgi:hypothetical protein